MVFAGDWSCVGARLAGGEIFFGSVRAAHAPGAYEIEENGQREGDSLVIRSIRFGRAPLDAAAAQDVVCPYTGKEVDPAYEQRLFELVFT